jgi:hypothetical protein
VEGKKAGVHRAYGKEKGENEGEDDEFARN